MYQEKLIPVLKAKIEKENHFNMCAQEGIVNMRYMTKYDTRKYDTKKYDTKKYDTKKYDTKHHQRFTAKLQDYSLAIFKIVQSHYLRQKYQT